jgi:hypothetical protein
MARPPGRPPLDSTSRTPSADVHLTLPASDYDKADRLAKERRESIQDVIRLGLKRLLTDEHGRI